MPDKILVVDDESHVRDSTVRLLQRKGYDAEGVGSGMDALVKVASNTYDLLLLDIKMPGMTGLELLRRIKEIDPDAMALFMTGYGTVENTIEALELGALGFVRKPMPIEELARVIEETLTRGRLRKENARLHALMPLFELSKVLLSEIDENKLFNLALDTALAEAKADSVQIMLKDDGNLVLKATRGTGAGLRIGEVIADELAVKAASSLEPVATNESNGDSAAATQQQSSCTIYIPLITRSAAIGVMKVVRSGVKSFRQSDVEFLFTLCGQAAIAIANARLFESVQTKQAEVETLLKRVIDTTEDERLRLSLELHDGPVQSIVASQYGVEASRILIAKNKLDEANTKLDTAEKTLAQSVHDLRGIVRDLHPPALDRLGLIPAVQEYLGFLEKDARIACHLLVKGETVRLAPGLERGVYYVVREAITNVRKHARASEINVLAEFRNDSLLVEIADNGKGFDPGELKYENSGAEHFGLRNMIERVKMLNGNISIESKPGRGTRVRLVVPVNSGATIEKAATFNK